MYKRRRPFRFFIILVLILLACGFYWIDRTLRSTILKIAEAQVVQMATEAIYSSVQQKVWDNNLEYQDFIQIHKDSQGRVVFMQANTIKVTKVAADITLAVQSALRRLEDEAMAIPIGQITGVHLLANLGPKINVTIKPVGTVKVNVEDKFEPAGINQTRHRIWLDFNTQVKIVIPAMTAQTVIATQVPLTESIIVGEVPSTFVNIPGGLFGEGFAK